MDEWELEVTVSNATGLKKVSTFEQNPYCSVWYTQGDAQRTPTHKKGGTDPTWNKVVRLPINHNQLENLHGSVMVDILHESHGRDGKIGTAIIPLSDMRNDEGTIRMYNVDPVGKIEVALMRKKKELGASTSGGKGRGVGSLGQPSSTSRSRLGLRKGFQEVVKFSNGINSISTAKQNLMNMGKGMHIGSHHHGNGKDLGEGGEEHEQGYRGECKDGYDKEYEDNEEDEYGGGEARDRDSL